MRRLATFNKAVNRVMLSAAQDHKIMVATLKLAPELRHSFTLRVERKLHLRGTYTVSDKLVTAIIGNVARQLQAKP